MFTQWVKLIIADPGDSLFCFVFLAIAEKVGVHSNPQDHFVHVPYGYLKYLV